MRRVLAAAGALVAVAALGVPAAANAVNWYSSTSPLTAKYGTATRAQAYGKFTDVNYSYARNTSTLRSRTSNPVYVQTSTDLLFQHAAVQVGPWGVGYTGWWNENSLGLNRDTTSWVTGYTPANPQSDAVEARGDTYVCEQRPWYNPDVCSAHTFPTFSY